MFNKVVMLGRSTRDIDLKYTQGGLAIAKLSFANSRQWNDKVSGEKKEEVCFIDCTIFGKSAEYARDYIKKGTKVLIEGRLIQENWTDQQGQKRSKHSINVDNFELVESKNASTEMSVDNNMPKTAYQPAPVAPATTTNTWASNNPIDDEDIPF